MRDIRPLHTQADYEWALREVERYFTKQPEPGSPEGNRFDVLSALITQFESDDIAVPDADPIDVLHFAIASMGRTQVDLARILGSSSRASEILNRKRRLTLDMIRNISAEWHIPVEALTADYALARQSA